MHLDGNAAGGILSEVFAADVTAARCTCAGCGTTEPLAMAHAYMGGPGTVLRCPHCDCMLLRVVRIRERVMLDAGGVRALELRAVD
jgi:Family of unknown function (DUF6510)